MDATVDTTVGTFVIVISAIVSFCLPAWTGWLPDCPLYIAGVVESAYVTCFSVGITRLEVLVVYSSPVILIVDDATAA